MIEQSCRTKVTGQYSIYEARVLRASAKPMQHASIVGSIMPCAGKKFGRLRQVNPRLGLSLAELSENRNLYLVIPF